MKNKFKKFKHGGCPKEIIDRCSSNNENNMYQIEFFEIPEIQDWKSYLKEMKFSKLKNFKECCMFKIQKTKFYGKMSL